MLTAGALAACTSGQRASIGNELPLCSPETSVLLENIKKVSSRGIMFGHQDDTVYGIGWEGEEGRSDIKSVCGDYPAVVGFDLGHIELGDSMNLDKVSFSNIRKEILRQYERGGLVSLSWHVRNPLTGGDSWDVSETGTVRSVLSGGDKHEMFVGWLERAADFFNSLRTTAGTKIPVLFRPWHEHTGSWFWWGEKLCSVEEYKALWHLTVRVMNDKGVDNVLYAYSPGAEPQDTVQYLKRYPGHELIDVLGVDIYQFDREKYLADLQRSLAIMDSIGRSHDKVIAVTETGYEGVPDPDWWTKTLLPAIEPYSPAYVLLWRNARERVTHYYAPYPGQVSADDFVLFYEKPNTLFVKDVDSLYK